jgi:hypothetical protein
MKLEQIAQSMIAIAYSNALFRRDALLAKDNDEALGEWFDSVYADIKHALPPDYELENNNLDLCEEQAMFEAYSSKTRMGVTVRVWLSDIFK